MPNRPSRVKTVHENYQLCLTELRDFGLQPGDELEIMSVEPADAPKPINASTIAVTIKPVNYAPRHNIVLKDLLSKLPPDALRNADVMRAINYATQHNLQLIERDMQQILADPQKWLRKAELLVDLGAKELRMRDLIESGKCVAVDDIFLMSRITSARMKVGVKLDHYISAIGFLFAVPIAMDSEAWYEQALDSLIHLVLYPRGEFLENNIRELLEKSIIPWAIRKWREYVLKGIW